MGIKLRWAVRLPDTEAPAIMFNDNGVWFTYGNKVSMEWLKTLLRALGKVTPVESVKILPVREAAPKGADYVFIIFLHGRSPSPEILLGRLGDDYEEDGLADIPLDEFSSLIGNPSRLVTDYWSAEYRNRDKYHLIVHWFDGQRERALNLCSLRRLAGEFEKGEMGGQMTQTDEETGQLHDFSWVRIPLNAFGGKMLLTPDRVEGIISSST